MGCNSSVSAKSNGTTQSGSGGSLEIYGVTASMNCMGPILLAMDYANGKVVPCMPTDPNGTRSDSFKAMNPFCGVPCLKTGSYALAESGAILRYLAEVHCPAAYPKEPKRRAFINWALDRFATGMYSDCEATVYPILGFKGPPKDAAAAAITCNANLQSWADCFLKEKFVGGTQVSIADYKIAPFLLAYSHPVLDSAGVRLPSRMKQFLVDFLAASGNSKMLSEAGGFSIKEMLDAKVADGGSKELLLTPATDPPEKSQDMVAGKSTKGSNIELYGVPGSANCLGPVMVAASQNLGSLKQCMPYEGTLTKEFLEMNPFHAVPTMKDSEFAVGESNTILRYLGALSKDADLYPADPQKRGLVDWAMDRFSTAMYDDVKTCIYPVLGYAGPPDDQAAAGKKCVENLESFGKVFLKEKFIGGSVLSIADYKVAPFFFCYEHEAIKAKSQVEIPKRIAQFNKDFKSSCGDHFKHLEVGGGSALMELLDAKK